MRNPHPEDPGSRRRTAPVSGGADRYEALLDVLEEQADRAQEDRREPPPRRSLKRILLGLFIAASAWVLVSPPGWLVPAAGPVQSIEEEEAALRFMIYLQAQRIRAYQLEHGALPETLESAGEPLPGMEYQVLQDDLYALTGASDRLRLTYRSDEPLRGWTGRESDPLRTTMP